MSYAISNVLESFLGRAKSHDESRGQITFDCPACSDEKSLSRGDGKSNLEVNYKKNVFNCWACSDHNNMHGPIIKLIKRFGTKENIKDFLVLSDGMNFEYKSTKKAVTLTLPEGFTRLSGNSHWTAKRANDYLRSERGISDDIIEKYNIGITNVDLYTNRIIIPSYDSAGNVNYFIARAITKKLKPKYLNPEAEKSTLIVNEGKIDLNSTIYLVEGMFDHIVIPNSIPLLGKYISDHLFHYLQNANGRIVIALDDDAYKDAIIAYNKLNTGNLLGRVYLCIIPKGYDPSKAFEKYGKDGIIKLLSQSFKPKENKVLI